MRRVIYSTKRIEASHVDMDDMADLYIVKIWYEIDPEHDVAAPEAAQEIIPVKAISPQQALEYAKMQWDGPIDRIEIVDINPDETFEDELYASTAIRATGRSYADKKTVNDNRRGRIYRPAFYPDQDPARIDALLDIDWTDVYADDCEYFLKDTTNFPDLEEIESISYVDDDTFHRLGDEGYDGGFTVRYKDGSEVTAAWIEGDEDNMYLIVNEVEGCGDITAAAEPVEEISFRDWLDQHYWEGFSTSDLSDEEFFELEDQYRAEVPKEQREFNYR